MFKNYTIKVNEYDLKLRFEDHGRGPILRAELWKDGHELNDCGWPTYIVTPINDLEAQVIANKVKDGLANKPPHTVMQEIGFIRKDDCRPPNTITFIKEV